MKNLFDQTGEPWGDEHPEISIVAGSAALSKACCDPFDYALGLRTGVTIRFEQARLLNNEWVHLTLLSPSMDEQPAGCALPYPADRGVDVRLSDIVWVMDAPKGS